MKVVGLAALAALRHCEAERNRDAHYLGVLLIEFEFRKDEILRRYKGNLDDRDRRIGVLLREFEEHKRGALERIQKSIDAQKEIGEKAMEEVHVNWMNPGKDYDIDLNNGVVRERREDGIYRPIE